MIVFLMAITKTDAHVQMLNIERERHGGSESDVFGDVSDG
jgi:hypothetical protein